MRDPLGPFFHDMPSIDIQNITIHYESIRVSQASDSTILVFLHEALGSIPQWRSFPSELCESLKLNGLVYERQGHGRSSSFTSERDHHYLHDYAWKELPAFLDAVVAPDQNIILIGHSDGGSIALLFASKFPKKVSAVITMAAHVINEPETIAGIDPAVKAFKEGKLSKLRAFHEEKTDDLFYAWANTWSSTDFSHWDITKDISTLRTPLLVIQGMKDQYGTIKQLELIRDHVLGPCFISHLEDCGHHPHLEKSTKVISLISEFVTLHSEVTE